MPTEWEGSLEQRSLRDMIATPTGSPFSPEVEARTQGYGHPLVYWDGSRLRRLRLSAGMTMHELSRQAGVGHGMISRWESSMVVPRLESLHKIRAALGCSWSDLLGGPDTRITRRR